MNTSPKISIIIPVYNCESFICNTLNSIQNQSFVDWECILVDDNSTDNVLDLLKEYEKKDLRFKVFEKPLEIKKGANASRNYGFLQSIGSYIKWFDCDDIMLPNHLERVFTILVENNLDFVITDTVNFDHESNEILGKPYNFDRNKAEITLEKYVFSQIGWITDDFFGSRRIVESLKFNEEIISLGDEYNFFIKLLHHSDKGVFVDEILTHRRVHINSITNINNTLSNDYLITIACLKYQTAQDLIIYDNKKLICWFLSGYMRISFDIALLKQTIPYKYASFKLICKYFSIYRGLIYITALFLGYYFNKGYNVMKYARS